MLYFFDIYNSLIFSFIYMTIYSLSLVCFFWSIFQIINIKLKTIYSFSDFNLNKFFQFLFSIIFFSLAGVPPFLGFFTKLFILIQLISSNFFFFFFFFTLLFFGLYFYLQNIKHLHSYNFSNSNNIINFNIFLSLKYIYFSIFIIFLLLFGFFFLDDIFFFFFEFFFKLYCVNLILKPKTFKYKKNFKLRKCIFTKKYFSLKFGDIGFLLMYIFRLDARKIHRLKLFLKKSSKKSDKTHRFFWLNCFPHMPLTRKPAGSRMGKGKGKLQKWYIQIKPFTMLIEFKNLRYGRTLFFFKQLNYKLNTKFDVFLNKRVYFNWPFFISKKIMYSRFW